MFVKFSSRFDNIDGDRFRLDSVTAHTFSEPHFRTVKNDSGRTDRYIILSPGGEDSKLNDFWMDAPIVATH